MASKKRKLSDFYGPKLHEAYNSLLKIKDSLVDEHRRSMQSTLDRTKPYSFSNTETDWYILKEEFNITPDEDHYLKLKNDYLERTETSRLFGQDQYMSSDDMYKHLTMLEKAVPQTSEAYARSWIDTFFFRTSAMAPDKKSMVLNLEYASATRSSDRSGYAAMLVSNSKAISVFALGHIPQLRREFPVTGFFVTEARFEFEGDLLGRHIPRALAEMHECAREMQKEILRGAVTNGHDWIFLILYLNKDNKGIVSFRQSLPVRVAVRRPGPRNVPEVMTPEPDLIAGILSHWIENGFSDIEEDDWFEVYKY